MVRLLSAPSVAPAFFGGLLLGYVMYDTTHYYLHHGQPSTGVPKNLKVTIYFEKMDVFAITNSAQLYSKTCVTAEIPLESSLSCSREGLWNHLLLMGSCVWNIFKS